MKGLKEKLNLSCKMFLVSTRSCRWSHHQKYLQYMLWDYEVESLKPWQCSLVATTYNVLRLLLHFLNTLVPGFSWNRKGEVTGFHNFCGYREDELCNLVQKPLLKSHIESLSTHFF